MHIELEWGAFIVLMAFAAFSILFLSRHLRRKTPDLSQSFLYRIEDASFPMLLADTNGIILRTNSLLTALFGYAEHELDGQAVEVLVPEMHRGGHAQLRNGYMEAPHPRPMAQRILYGLRKDGHTIPIEIGLSPTLSSQKLLIAVTVTDATAKLHWEDKLLTTNAFLSSIIHCAPFSIIATDLDGNITAVSPAAERMLWYSEKELLHKHSPQLIHDASEVNHRARELSAELGETISGFEVFVAKARRGLVETREWTYIRKDGSRFQVELTVTALRGADERMVGFMGIAYDISERKRKDEYIHFLAHHDVLTGLPNRTLLQDRLDMAIERARRFGQKVGLILVDLDHFKRVNDSMGHHTGDQLLIEVAKRLQAGVRSIDTVARMGGDEFVIVITDIDEPASLVPLAEKLEREIAEPIDAGMHRLRITASIGVCLYPDDGDNAAVLLRHADVAMYEAKAEGRDTVKSFSLRMAHAITERVELERELRNAIDMQQFELVYQPILSLRSGDVVAVEALLRWHHPTLGSIPPNIFIPVAEDSGLIVPIGEWVLRTACTQARNIQQSTGRSLLMCVNLSPRQLAQPNIADVVQMALADSNLPAQTLELEITENVLIDQTDNAARQLADIRRLGVRIAIDDFGTGYSSLAYITQFTIDKIKIDRSFVRNLDDEGHSRTVINAIIAMAQGLKVEVTAEGIETDMQREYLTASHCDHGQGFLFGRPVPAAELPALLAQLVQRAMSPAV